MLHVHVMYLHYVLSQHHNDTAMNWIRSFNAIKKAPLEITLVGHNGQFNNWIKVLDDQV